LARRQGSPHEDGDVFIALSADRYPIGVIGWRNTAGDLFVSSMFPSPHTDFTSAVDEIKQSGLN
jgi:hypothetical protein